MVIAFCVVIIVLTHRNSEDLKLLNAWLLVLFTVTTALIIACFFNGAPGAIALAIIAGAQRFVAAFIWLAVTDVAHNSDYASDATFGLGKGLYALAVALGLQLSTSLGLSYGDLRLSLLVVYVLMVSLFFLLRDKTPHPLRLLSDLVPKIAAGSASQLTERVDSLAAIHGLSEREKEIVVLYAQGRSRSYISTQLYISENTVRDHIRNVYRKMGIHNKQALINSIQE
jgi:DNA-binding CsgD family transcriptional regulator